MKTNLSVFLIVIFLLCANSIVWANSFDKQYDFSIRLYHEKDYYRSITEILKLTFQFPKKVFNSDIKIYHLKNLYFLEQYDELIKQANSILTASTQFSEETIIETSKILTTAYLKQNNSKKAFKIWSNNFEGESLQDFPLETKMPDLINSQQAGLYSAIVPGSGFLLSENYDKATTSFLLNALFIAGCVNYYKKKQWGITALLLFFEIGWYQGGIRASIEYADRYNQKIIQTHQNRWINQYTPYTNHP